jgi:L-2-hydroxyglutarate oxidase LhgO
MDSVDCIVVGAGVAGLAVARALALAGLEVVVVEKEDRIGSGISARNSEVIHAGLYYPPGSLKARLCVEGKERLYAYCAERGVNHRRLGKLVVAVEPSQAERLEAIRDNAQRNGVTDLRMLSRAQTLALEPELEAASALLSPSTGIIDAPGYMLALQGDAEAAGAAFVFRTTVAAAAVEADRVTAVTRDAEGGTFELSARLLVNAAGLDAPSLAARIDGFPPDSVPRQWLARGCYFTLSGRSPFSHLIYPVPVEGGLGIHLTLDLGGQARFGPDVEWVDTVDFTVNPGREASFRDEIRRYWPTLPAGTLQPAYSGIRPKL